MVILKKFLEPFYFFLTILSINLVFFFDFYFLESILYSGKDSIRLHYASRIFLSESFSQGIFPIWTDKMFGGYPIFYDLERGFQNIFNVLAIYLLGPYNSYKLLFLTTFLIGSLSLYFLLIKMFQSNFTVNLIMHLLYFYSFFNLFHLQHQNFTYVAYLFPAIILFSFNFLNSKKIRYTIFISVIYYFLITFGAIQMVLLSVLGQLLFLWCYKSNIKDFRFSIIGLLIPSFLISIPSLLFFYYLYSFSERISLTQVGVGNFNLQYFTSYLFPFILGNVNYLGFTLNPQYFKHEFIVYFSFSGFLILLHSLSKRLPKAHITYFYFCLTIFLILNIVTIFPFDLFRYWMRAIFLINFATILVISDFLSRSEEFEISKYFYYLLSFFIILFFINFLNSDFLFIVRQSIRESYLEIAILLSIFFLFLLFIKIPKLLPFLIIFELIFFISRNNFHLYAPIARIDTLRFEINNLNEYNDDYSLLKLGPSNSIYSQTVPRDRDLLNDINFLSKFSIVNFLTISCICIALFFLYLIVLFKYVYNSQK